VKPSVVIAVSVTSIVRGFVDSECHPFAVAWAVTPAGFAITRSVQMTCRVLQLDECFIDESAKSELNRVFAIVRRLVDPPEAMRWINNVAVLGQTHRRNVAWRDDWC
jgi:hypothetical protein